MGKTIFETKGLFYCQWPPSWAQITLIGIILTSASIVSSTSGIIYFSVKLHESQSYNYLHAYQQDQCKIVSTSIREFNCSSGIRWILSLMDDQGRKAVENPFAWRRTKKEVQIEESEFVLGRNETCMCRPPGYTSGQDCQNWPRCILDEDFVIYIQHDNARYQNSHIRFIIVSVISLVLCVAFLPISLKTLRKELQRESYIEL